MDVLLTPIGLVLVLVLAAEFVNGWTDAPNAIATVVSTRVLSPGAALGMAAVLNVLGTMSGTAVAATIGKGIVKPEVVGLTAVMQQARAGRLDPDQRIVIVLTSGGLKDYAASRAWLPEMPAAGSDFASTLTVLEQRYGLRLRP